MPHSICLHHCRRRDPTGFCGGPLTSIYSSADSSRSLRSSINYSHPLVPSHPSSFASRNLSFFCFPPLVFTRFSVPLSSVSLSQVLISLSYAPFISTARLPFSEKHPSHSPLLHSRYSTSPSPIFRRVIVHNNLGLFPPSQ